MSQACGCGKEKRPAIGPGSGRTARGKRGAPPWSGIRQRTAIDYLKIVFGF
ncbi:hypothetical protein [Bacillus licheniformis]|uniref:hypothetical protein n=1 Tax=Bacillus licheniformis TaxID=1402 RepID=UPI00196B30C3|nr:hypothetical protein [Bacillus licheniformis]